MAISTRRAYQLAQEGELPVDEIIKTLYESEGVQGCRLVSGMGHPLQHVAVLLGPVAPRKNKASRMARAMLEEAQSQGGMTPLEEAYWRRGPGNPGIRYHSMFQSDEQAGAILQSTICGDGGVRALNYLTISDEITVCLAAYPRRFDETFRRLGDQLDRNRFVMNVETTSLVVAVLHSRYGTLHIHTAFPTRARQHQDVTNLNPSIGWELEVTDWVTGEHTLVRPNLVPRG
jgi:hypothetical protein